MQAEELVRYLDAYLRIGDVPDSSRAWNGLQVEGTRAVERLGVAVDCGERTLADAVERGCDFLIVHHGLFWDGGLPVVGRRYRRLRRLLEAGVWLYGAHIPLDVHPEVGNSAVLARALGVEIEGTFGDYDGVDIGVKGRLEIRREALAARLHELLNQPVRLLAGGVERVRTVGVITGAGGGMIGDAIGAGVDAFVTGEGAHHTWFDAMEGGINVYYGGHYATETWGVRALASHLEERFGLTHEFIDHPTGL
jgi:dinuclear metal center YbgI/SA1388 family protein